MFAYYQERLENKKTKEQAKDNSLGKGKDHSDPSSVQSSIIASSNPKKQDEKAKSDLLYLKLDIKFDLPTYNGELNAENLDDWIRQIEVYCKIQKITDDSENIKFSTLRPRGTALICWESKTHEYLLTKGKIISS